MGAQSALFRWVTAAAALIAAGMLAACRPETGAGLFPPGFAPDQPATDLAITAANVSRLQELRRFPAAVGPVIAGAFAPDAHQLVSLGLDRIVRIWDADTGRLLDEVTEHAQAGRGVAYSPDGMLLVSGGRSAGEDVLIWNTRTRQEIATVSLTGWVIDNIAWAPDGSRFALVSRGSSRVFIYTPDGVSLTQRRPSGQWLWSVAWSDDWLAVSDELGTTFVYTADDYTFRRELPHAVRYAGRDLQFSPDQSLLAGCFIDGSVSIWQVEDWSTLTTFQAHEYIDLVMEGCQDSAFSRYGDLYFTVGDDGWLIAWDPLTGERLFDHNFEQSAKMAAVSADGELLAVALMDGTVRVFGLPASFASR